MEESILRTIKKLLLISEEDPAFDLDILVHINSAIMTLRQLGVGPSSGFSVTGDSETWYDFLSGNVGLYQQVKTYIYLKVKLIFDPPPSSSVLEAYQAEIAELEWRLNIQAEGYFDECTT